MPNLLRAPDRVVRTPVVDSRHWNRFEPREDDIVIATFAKCGTTWTQRIVDLLVFQTPEVRPFGVISPWLDSTLFDSVDDNLARLKAQTHRRYIKSHLPFDALPVWDTVKYIHVGRDGRDARLSWQNHERGFRRGAAPISAPWRWRWRRSKASRRPDRRRPPLRTRAAIFCIGSKNSRPSSQPRGGTHGEFPIFQLRGKLLAGNAAGPTFCTDYYNDLKEDLAGEMRRIADFLDIAVPRH